MIKWKKGTAALDRRLVPSIARYSTDLNPRRCCSRYSLLFSKAANAITNRPNKRSPSHVTIANHLLFQEVTRPPSGSSQLSSQGLLYHRTCVFGVFFDGGWGRRCREITMISMNLITEAICMEDAKLPLNSVLPWVRYCVLMTQEWSPSSKQCCRNRKKPPYLLGGLLLISIGYLFGSPFKFN